MAGSVSSLIRFALGGRSLEEGMDRADNNGSNKAELIRS